ncbi:pX [Titi monkey adenovirus ECC-2011]|uniref:PX n=1 Tax=titi monkey adenovirus 1 TaxID=3123084 RepID=G0ZAI3_9ADEN|nr:pX [Titi monkey adenovirus ECC-2011]AEK98454.1 pX [Titi monkey adenovirus ECC-2011]
MASKMTCRIRIPVPYHPSRRRRRGGLSGSGLGGGARRLRRRRAVRGHMRGGFLQALIPIIAAAVGTIPGIASVALQASRRN